MNPLDSLPTTLTWHHFVNFSKKELSTLNKEAVEPLIIALLNPESVQEHKKTFPNVQELRTIPFRAVSRLIRHIQVFDEEQMDRLSQAMTTANIWPELSLNPKKPSPSHELHLAIRKAAIKGNFVAAGFFLEHLQAISSPSNPPAIAMSMQDRQVTGELLAISFSKKIEYDLLKETIEKVINLSIKSRDCIRVAVKKMVSDEESEPQYKKQRIFRALADLPNDEVEGVATAFQQWDVKAVFRQYSFCMPVVRTEFIKILRALAPEHRDLFRELYSTKFNDHGKLIPLLCAMNKEVCSLVYELIKEKNWEKEDPIKRYVDQIAPCSVEEAKEIYKIHQGFEDDPLDFYPKATILSEIKNTSQTCRQEVADIVASILKTSWNSSKPLNELIPENREDLTETVRKWLEKVTVRRYLDALISPPKSRYDSYHESLKNDLSAALASLSFQSLEELFPALKQIEFKDLSIYSKDLLAILLELNPAHRETFATLFATRSIGEGELIAIVCSVKESETESKIYKLIESSRWTFKKNITRFVDAIHPCSFEEALELYTSYEFFNNPLDIFPLDLELMSKIKSLPAGSRVETTRKASIIAASNPMIKKDPECIVRLGKLAPEDQEEVFQAVYAWEKETGIGAPKDIIDTFTVVPRGQRVAYGNAVLCHEGWCLYNLVEAVKNSAPEKRGEVCAAMIYFKDEKLLYEWTIRKIIAQVRKLPVGESQEFCEALKLLNNGHAHLNELMPILEKVPVGDRVSICKYFPEIFETHSHIAWDGTANYLIKTFSRLNEEQRNIAQKAILEARTAYNCEKKDSHYEKVICKALNKRDVQL